MVGVSVEDTGRLRRVPPGKWERFFSNPTCSVCRRNPTGTIELWKKILVPNQRREKDFHEHQIILGAERKSRRVTDSLCLPFSFGVLTYRGDSDYPQRQLYDAFLRKSSKRVASFGVNALRPLTSQSVGPRNGVRCRFEQNPRAPRR